MCRGGCTAAGVQRCGTARNGHDGVDTSVKLPTLARDEVGAAVLQGRWHTRRSRVVVLPVGPLQCNCVVIVRCCCPSGGCDLPCRVIEDRRKSCRDGARSHCAIVVDPGGDGVRIAGVVEAYDAIVTRVVITHGHLDHFGGVGHLLQHLRKQQQHSPTVHLHGKDWQWWQAWQMQATMMGYPPTLAIPMQPHEKLAHGQRIQIIPRRCGAAPVAHGVKREEGGDAGSTAEAATTDSSEDGDKASREGATTDSNDRSPKASSEDGTEASNEDGAKASSEDGAKASSKDGTKAGSRGTMSSEDDLCIRVVHTPGHTPGSACLWVEDLSLLLTGDTLFHGSVGRTDLPGGSHATLMHSIQHRLLPLETDGEGTIAVVPGHGPLTTLQHEKSTNPFLQRGVSRL